MRYVSFLKIEEISLFWLHSTRASVAMICWENYLISIFFLIRIIRYRFDLNFLGASAFRIYYCWFYCPSLCPICFLFANTFFKTFFLYIAIKKSRDFLIPPRIFLEKSVIMYMNYTLVRI